ncbi:unnamed protein product [Parascedosporium putredinis]|uniref:Uncharacterized protein n=1 Tax=Parascedosporium putredinis TaxID=1442378 RepID=A0A9P1HB87_9PEZI|nr:unnamed protein product [Parascedosporium putredinis]CAI8001896.1 unnamed protein product [Parascedosporium putredinis]
MYNRDNRIMRKLLGRAAPDSTTDTSTGGAAGITSAPSIAGPAYRSTVSQNAEYKAGVPILCLDASPDRRAAVNDGFDLRAVISAQPSIAKSGSASSIADQLSIKDVKWHGDSTIFTACSNGKIFSYDITRFGSGSSNFEFVQTMEDSRQDPAAQPAGGLTFRAVQGFKCNADSVRHVKWSPTDGLCFACGTESGVIMKWDIRKPASPLLRLPAHDKACSAISWHPDAPKAKWTISTPAPVATVAWRPGLWSATAQGKRVAQVAVTYDDTSQKRYGINAIHIWDLARPTMPFKEIDRFDAPPSGLLWKDQDLLWTAGRDGVFSQCDPKRLGGGRGRYFVGPRRRIHRTQQRRHSRSIPNTGASSTPPLAPTPPDDHNLTLDQSLKVTGLFKSQQAMAFGHAPAATNVETYHYLAASYLRILEQELPCSEGSKPFVDRVETILQRYARTAENARLFRLGQTWRILAYVANLLLLQRGQYHLEKRLGISPEVPKDVTIPKTKEVILQVPLATADQNGEETPRRLPSQAGLGAENRNLSVRSLLAEEIESTSNVPTPVVRAIRDTDDDNGGEVFIPGKRLTPVIEPESFTLGPAAHPQLADSPRRRLDSEPISIESNGSADTEQSITEGYDFYDTQALTKAIDVPKVGKPAPGRLTMDPKPRIRIRHASRIQDLLAEREEREAARMREKNPDGEYESRIRGKELEESPDITPARPQPRPKYQPQSEFPDDIFMISQSVIGTDVYSQGSVQSNTQSNTQSNPRSEYEHLNDEGDDDDESNGLELRVKKSNPNTKTSLPSPSKDQSQDITEHDYLYWPGDLPYPFPLSSRKASFNHNHPAGRDKTPPIDPYTVISRAIEFEARTSALNASAMVLLFRPLVPPSVIDPFHAMAILRQHHTRLMGMKHFVEAAQLRNVCVGFYCSACRKPREIDPRDGALSVWRCSRCRTHMAPCAVCGHRVAPAVDLDDPALCTWWYCPGCAHGGHASCLQAWHADQDPDGCCPTDGCGHACLPGRYRAETGTARSDELGRYVVADKVSGGPKVRVASGGGGGASAGAGTGGGVGGAAGLGTGISAGVSTSAPLLGSNATALGAGGGLVVPASGSASTVPSSVRSDVNDVPQSRAVETHTLWTR